jgi:energy-converting hydrogenase B subunit D
VNALEAIVLLLVAAGGTAVVLTRDPLNQAILASFYGLLLGLAFLVLQSPDVALSQITVGAVALPLMILLALAKVRRDESARARAGPRTGPRPRPAGRDRDPGPEQPGPDDGGAPP